jgi:membrane protein
MRAPHCADFCAAIKRIRTPVDFVNGFVSVATRMVNKRILRLIKIFTGTQTGTRDELFQLEGRLERFVHFWVLVFKSFVRNRCLVRASALSYSTVLAMIPLLAVAISVTSSLLKTQGEDKIYSAINKFVATIVPPEARNTNGPATALALTNFSTAQNKFTLTPTNPVADTNSFFPSTSNPASDAPVVSVSAQKAAAQWIHEFVGKTQSGTLGFTGMILLVVVAISMLSRIESTFNDIWGVTRARNWLLQIVLYWTAVTLGPLLLATALALAGGSQFQAAKDLVGHTPFIGTLGFEFLPLIVIWLTFALIYQLVPNTKVNFTAALVGGIMGGTLWHLNNVFGFLYVSRVVSNGQIYGPLYLVPVFMIGLYFSWAILLFGAQVAYAFQNRAAYLQDKLAENVNQRGREFVSLRLMTFLGRRFQHGLPPATIQQISSELEIPSRLVLQVLQTLLATRLVSEVAGAETAYVPARPLESINAYHILLAMRTGGGQELPQRDELGREEVFGEFARIEEAERKAASSVTMLELVNRAEPRIEIAAPARPEK